MIGQHTLLVLLLETALSFLLALAPHLPDYLRDLGWLAVRVILLHFVVVLCPV